jgi:hypothetical protein
MSRLPQGGFQQRAKTGRRRAIVYGALLLLFLAVWSVVVLSWGPSSEEAGGRGQGGSQANAGQSQGSGADSEREVVPDEPASAQQETGAGTTKEAGGNAPSGGQSGGQVATPTGQGAPAGAGRQHADPAEYRPDPLGTGTSEGDLAPVDEERVRFAAARFVTAAYGYSGDNTDAYNQGVGRTVAWPVFYESPGSREIERFAAQVEETGTKSAALLTRFELTGGSGSEASGYAYFETGEGYGQSGGLTGPKTSYRQKMTLVRSGGAWIVKATEPVEET